MVLVQHLPVSGTDRGRSPRRRVGAQISTLVGLRDGFGPAGLGRVACFVVRRGARRWTQPMLLTSHHVLTAHGASPGDPVFAPRVIEDGAGLAIDPESLARVAETTAEGIDGTNRSTFLGAAGPDIHLDGGLARLTDHDLRPAGDVAFRVALVHPHDALPQRALSVYLLGVHEGPAGQVVDIDATVERADGTVCPGTIVIRSLPGCPPFAGAGDSGALVVDRHRRAIGLLWGVDLVDPTVAYACHLQPLLNRLQVVPSLRPTLVRPSEEVRRHG